MAAEAEVDSGAGDALGMVAAERGTLRAVLSSRRGTMVLDTVGVRIGTARMVAGNAEGALVELPGERSVHVWTWDAHGLEYDGGGARLEIRRGDGRVLARCAGHLRIGDDRSFVVSDGRLPQPVR